LTAANQEIGIATLEYIPPQTTTMEQIAEIDFDAFDEETASKTILKTKTQIMF